MVLKLKWAHSIWMWCLILTVAAGCNKDNVSRSFNKLLDEASLVFTAPQGFQPLSPVANPLLPYEHAIHTADGKLEVRLPYVRSIV